MYAWNKEAYHFLEAELAQGRSQALLTQDGAKGLNRQDCSDPTCQYESVDSCVLLNVLLADDESCCDIAKLLLRILLPNCNLFAWFSS